MKKNFTPCSMWPLLKKDGLGVQYIAMLVLWNRLIGYNPFSWQPKSFIHLFSLVSEVNIIVYCHANEEQAVCAAAVTLHALELVVTPPRRYPDLFPVLNVLVCTPVLVLAWLWSIKSGMEVAWTVGGVGPARTDESVGKEAKRRD